MCSSSAVQRRWCVKCRFRIETILACSQNRLFPAVLSRKGLVFENWVAHKAETLMSLWWECCNEVTKFCYSVLHSLNAFIILWSAVKYLCILGNNRVKAVNPRFSEWGQKSVNSTNWSWLTQMVFCLTTCVTLDSHHFAWQLVAQGWLRSNLAWVGVLTFWSTMLWLISDFYTHCILGRKLMCVLYVGYNFWSQPYKVFFDRMHTWQHWRSRVCLGVFILAYVCLVI